MLNPKIILCLLFVIYFILSVPYYSGDIKNHLAWAVSLLDHGTLGFYGRDFPGFAFPNYPTVAMVLFALGLKLYQLINQIAWFLNTSLPIFPSQLIFYLEWENVMISFLKLPAILANFGIAWYLYLNFKKLWISVAFLFNPAIFYLSGLWGQIDLLSIMFLLFAFYFLKTKAYLSSAFVSLALLSKQTVIIFVPFFLFALFKNYGFKESIKNLLFITMIFYISYLPFNQNSLLWPFEFYLKNFNMVAYSVNENAINLWGFLFNFARVSDLQNFLFLDYQQWGYLLFAALTIWPTYIFFKSENIDKRIWEYFLIITLIYFFVLTRMHERYLAPAVVFTTILAVKDKRYRVILIGISVIHFLNLYRGLHQPNISIFNILVDSIIYLKIMVVGYAVLIYYNVYAFLKKGLDE